MLPFSSIFDILMSSIYTGKLCTFALSGFLRAQRNFEGLKKINKDKFHALLEDEALYTKRLEGAGGRSNT
ncbi:hypothetical protein MKW92_022884 [Papaver armeniacum]|nr:hypothetical protein MKW92_022884 [Papaver armeniacum]